MSNGITEGEKDLVSEFMAETILKLQPLIEGKFVDRFDVTFVLDGRTYELSLKKVNDPFLPTGCQSKKDGICNLKKGTCQQCL